MSKIISKYKDTVNNALSEKLNYTNQLYKNVIDAMNYSVSIGGKRIRPCLVMEFASLCDGNMEAALDMACAIEMIHTYSLIHDDLPCMDDDDLRRGKPSCHVKFGEATALLAGDALLTHAFQTAAGAKCATPESIAECVRILSKCAGVNGMIGGQVIDLESEGKAIGIDTVITLNALKTSCLLQAAAMLGCAVSCADNAVMTAAENYGFNLGLAFQIVDDILDVTGDISVLGKPIGSDAENNKSNFVSLLGLDEAKKQARLYTDKAIESLEIFGIKADDLRELTNELISRSN